jgi:hypothetical protein
VPKRQTKITPLGFAKLSLKRGSRVRPDEALCEFVDNAIEHGEARVIRIWLQGKCLYFNDNGVGLSEPAKLLTQGDTGAVAGQVSQFGVGAALAAWSLSDSPVIETVWDGKVLSCVEKDADSWTVIPSERKARKGEKGTTIILPLRTQRAVRIESIARTLGIVYSQAIKGGVSLLWKRRRDSDFHLQDAIEPTFADDGLLGNFEGDALGAGFTARIGRLATNEPHVAQMQGLHVYFAHRRIMVIATKDLGRSVPMVSGIVRLSTGFRDHLSATKQEVVGAVGASLKEQLAEWAKPLLELAGDDVKQRELESVFRATNMQLENVIIGDFGKGRGTSNPRYKSDTPKPIGPSEDPTVPDGVIDEAEENPSLVFEEKPEGKAKRKRSGFGVRVEPVPGGIDGAPVLASFDWNNNVATVQFNTDLPMIVSDWESPRADDAIWSQVAAALATNLVFVECAEGRGKTLSNVIDVDGNTPEKQHEQVYNRMHHALRETFKAVKSA